MSLKLLIIMGIPWIFEFIHFLLVDHVDNMDCYVTWQVTPLGWSSNHLQRTHILCFSIPLHFKPLLQIVVSLFDFLNMHRGSLFFLIFVCKKSILDQVQYFSTYWNNFCSVARKTVWQTRRGGGGSSGRDFPAMFFIFVTLIFGSGGDDQKSNSGRKPTPNLNCIQKVLFLLLSAPKIANQPKRD